MRAASKCEDLASDYDFCFFEKFIYKSHKNLILFLHRGRNKNRTKYADVDAVEINYNKTPQSTSI